DLAEKISKIVGYTGDIVFDKSKPDGMMRKLLDVSKITKLGWKAKTSLDDGIKKAYNYYRDHFKS
ncbi:MAG: GDP-L-fucose synthase, partial [Candidatus Heimdallarchaeota archaeon]|nr:GDP-L-fucose synthase [Candidatus Heimdallarchaeota archaeon]